MKWKIKLLFLKKKEKPIKVTNPFFERRIENVYFNEFRNNNLKNIQVFNFGHDFVIYFEKQLNSDTDRFIRANYRSIQNRFNAKGRNFFYMPIVIENKNNFIVPLLKECFPDFDDLSYLAINEEVKKSFQNSNFTEDFFKFINYEGTISRGCISSNNSFTILEHKQEELIEDFINDYILYLPSVANGGNIYYQLDPKALQTLKKETIESYATIKTNLEKLRDNGELILIAPKLYKLLENNIQGIRFDDIAPITITKDFKILINNNENLEIKLSHLTKTIFIFFLFNKEDIHIKELIHHEKMLLSIYKHVSNQLSHDRMKESIQELINPNNDAIYTHFSRLKKEIQNHFEPYAAKYYLVSGRKGEPKKISLPKEKIIFEVKMF
jgi:hypothetical protein